MIDPERYEIVELLAMGGMSEVYLARTRSVVDFSKWVVVKRLQPELASDHRLVDMFLDEARIGALLDHPHIVAVFEAGMYEGVPYMVQEYVRGQELHVLCRRGLAVDAFLPLGYAVELIRQAATALGYCHSARDAQGQPLELVHCDISPSNLLVSDEGFLSLLDFGIARARTQRAASRRIIPGKPSYMSPEQAACEPFDQRSDIFSLGIVLYEITVGKRLFRGPAAEVIDRLQGGDVPLPTFVRRDFPGRLEGIVMRALERDPADRYQSAYELAGDLEDFLGETGMHAGPVRIARYLDALAAASGRARRPEFEELGGAGNGATADPAAAGASGDDRDDGEEAEAELDFDREIFRTLREDAPELSWRRKRAAAWEEYDEADDDVAAAFGLDLDTYRQARR